MTTIHTGGTSDTWAKIAAQYGFAAALCAAVLYFVGYQMILPMQETHKQLIQEVSSTNQQNARTNSQNAETLRTQTAILERIDATMNGRPRAYEVGRSEER